MKSLKSVKVIFLKSKEQRLIIATGILYIITGIITSLITVLTSETTAMMLPLSVRDFFKIAMIVGVVIGCGLSTFFGIMVLLYKRWALVILRVFMIMGLVGLFFTIDQSIKVNNSLPLAYVVSLGLDIIILCLINKAAKALSSDVQSCREIVENAKGFAVSAQ